MATIGVVITSTPNIQVMFHNFYLFYGVIVLWFATVQTDFLAEGEKSCKILGLNLAKYTEY